MKERPILFQGAMVRALLAGTKTQTRRVVKPQPPAGWDRHCWYSAPVYGWTFQPVPTVDWHKVRCPYGQPGDRLWVRETSRAHELTDKEAEDDTFGVIARLGLEQPPYGLDGVVYAADGTFREISSTREASERWLTMHEYRGLRGATVPGIHMPRWASRILLEITAVRVERLQSINEIDAAAEGVDEWGRGALSPESQAADPSEKFRWLWDSINGQTAGASWSANPFVWAIEFKRVQP